MAGPVEESTTYARLCEPVRFFSCDVCKGMVREVDGGYARDAPLGSPCSCATPTIAPRRVTAVTTTIVKRRA